MDRLAASSSSVLQVPPTATIAVLLLCLPVLVCTEDPSQCPCSCLNHGRSHSMFEVDCSQLGLRRVCEVLPRCATRPFHASVNLDQNEITTLNKFPRLSYVTAVSVRQSGVKAIEEMAFADLDGLRSLDLSHNQLVGDAIRPDVFRGRATSDRYEPLPITAINLAHNKLRWLNERALEHLPDLAELVLDHNPLVTLETVLTALAAPRALTALSLAHTGLADLPHDLVQLPSVRNSLRRLRLDDNQLVEVPPSLAALGNTLTFLSLDGNLMTNLTADSFLGLLRLRELRVSRLPRLTHVGPATFEPMSALRVLHCARNQRLNQIDAEAFRVLRDRWPLSELYLHDNALRSLDRSTMPWQRLDVLRLQNNPWNCDCDLDWLYGKTAAEPNTLFCTDPISHTGTDFAELPLCSKEDDRSPEITPQPNDVSAVHSQFEDSTVVLAVSIAVSSTVALAVLWVRFKPSWGRAGGPGEALRGLALQQTTPL